MKTLLQAAFLASMDQSITRDGAVVFSCQSIIDVGDSRTLRARHPDAAITDLGDSILLPGLVNAHAHLELSACDPARGVCDSSFVDWIVGIRNRVKLDEGGVAESIEVGVNQCLKFGMTTVGDISQQMHLTRPLLKGGPLRVVSFGEVLGLAKRRHRFDELFPLAIDQTHSSERLRIGISPHAPYTVDLPGYRQVIEHSARQNVPLATHLAETPDEHTFLNNSTGAFQEMWERLGWWADVVPTFDGSPVQFAQAVGLLDQPAVLAHVNYCDDDDLELLSRGRASVVYCPRTHAYFRHPPHRWRQMLARGVNVAVGTDSCASSPDLNLMDDLRLVRKLAPDMPAEEIWQMATTRAASALQMDRQVGSISPGKAADIVSFDVTTDWPLEELLQNDRTPAHLWIAGEYIMPRTRPASPDSPRR